MKKITKKLLKEQLMKVMDPELNISIIDLGLIYEIKMDKNNQIIIIMTLTTSGCPLADMIQSEIKNKIKQLGVKDKDIKINLTFDPPWTMEKMSKKGKTILGI